MCVTQSTPRIFTSPCVIVVLPAALSPTIPRMIGRCLVTGTPPYGLALVTAIRARVVRTISQSATSNLTLPQFHRLTQFGAGLGCIIECFAGGNRFGGDPVGACSRATASGVTVGAAAKEPEGVVA